MGCDAKKVQRATSGESIGLDVLSVEPFCQPDGEGHPEFGRAWFGASKAERSGLIAGGGG